jgi:hypothetical protein
MLAVYELRLMTSYIEQKLTVTFKVYINEEILIWIVYFPSDLDASYV